MDQTPNLFDTVFAAMQKVTQSPYAYTILVLLAAFGVYVTFETVHGRRRFDPTRHQERLPEEKPLRSSLPPAQDYIEWERERDKEKDGMPWN